MKRLITLILSTTLQSKKTPLFLNRGDFGFLVEPNHENLN